MEEDPEIIAHATVDAFEMINAELDGIAPSTCAEAIQCDTDNSDLEIEDTVTPKEQRMTMITDILSPLRNAHDIK